MEFIKKVLYDKDRITKTLGQFEKFFVNNYTLYYDSMDNYTTGSKPNQKRILIYGLLWILSVVHTFEFWLMLNYHDEVSIRIIGCTLIIATNQLKVIYSIEFLCSIVLLMTKGVMLYKELNRRFYVIDLIHSWMSSPYLFGLNCSHTKKMIIRTQLLYWFLVLIFSKTIIYMVNIVTLIYGIIGYLYYDFPIVNLTIHSIIWVFYVNHGVKCIMFVPYAIYLPIIYLNYKFEEFFMAFRARIWWNNKQGLLKSIASHNNITQLTDRLAEINNIVVGVIHLIVPYIIVLGINAVFKPGFNAYMKFFSLIILILAIIAIYQMNLIFASITLSNQNAPKFIYRVLCKCNYIDLRSRLKIEDFLSKLNYEYIGFYCLNMFKFTKMSFYQYLLTCSSAYILVTDFLKWWIIWIKNIYYKIVNLKSFYRKILA